MSFDPFHDTKYCRAMVTLLEKDVNLVKAPGIRSLGPAFAHVKKTPRACGTKGIRIPPRPPYGPFGAIFGNSMLIINIDERNR